MTSTRSAETRQPTSDESLGLAVAGRFVGEIGGRIHLRWRLRLTNPDVGPGTFLVEQQVDADARHDGRLRNVALLCSGYFRDAS